MNAPGEDRVQLEHAKRCHCIDANHVIAWTNWKLVQAEQNIRDLRIKLAQAEQRVAGLGQALMNPVAELSDLQVEAVCEGCGNTNAAVLHLRIHEAKKALAAALTPPPPAPKEEG